MSDLLPVSPLEYTTQRHFEWQIFRLRWLVLPLAFALVTALRSPSVWLSLLTLTGYLGHNLIRARLLSQGTVNRLRLFGGLLLLADLGMILLALAPMVLAGVIAMEVLLFALQLEVVLRLSLEPPRISVPVVGGVTLILAVYAWVLDTRLDDGPEIVSLWVALLGVVGVAGAFYACQQWRVMQVAWQPVAVSETQVRAALVLAPDASADSSIDDDPSSLTPRQQIR